MASLKDFLVEEHASLQELSKGFTSEYREQVMQSFIESPLMPGGSLNLLLLAEGAPAKELLHNFTLAAYDRFVASYLEQVAAYATLAVAELGGGDLPALSGQFKEPGQLDLLLDLFAGARSDDPVLEWFVNEGAALLNDVRARLSVKEVDGLAALVRQLEYYSLFFNSTTGDVESYSFIVDIPERANSELAELGLLAVARQVENLSGVVLDPESYREVCNQDAFQLVDWHRSILKIDTKEADSIARHIEEWKEDSIKQARQVKTARLNSLTSAFPPVLEISMENIKVQIKTGEKDRGGSDGQANHPSPSMSLRNKKFLTDFTVFRAV